MKNVLAESFIDFSQATFGKDFISLHRPIFEGNERQYLIDCIDSNFVSSVGARVVEFEEKVAEAIHSFAAIDGISEEQATALVNSGFHTLEDLLQVELEDLSEIPEIAQDAATILESVRTETQSRISAAENEESTSEGDS